jgi:hypothetical protein
MNLTVLYFSEAVVRDLEPPLSLHPCPPALIIVCTLLIFMFDWILLFFVFLFTLDMKSGSAVLLILEHITSCRV